MSNSRFGESQGERQMYYVLSVLSLVALAVVAFVGWDTVRPHSPKYEPTADAAREDVFNPGG